MGANKETFEAVDDLRPMEEKLTGPTWPYVIFMINHIRKHLA